MNFETNVNTEDVFFELNSGTKTSLFQSLIAIMNPQIKKRLHLHMGNEASQQLLPSETEDGRQPLLLTRARDWVLLPSYNS